MFKNSEQSRVVIMGNKFWENDGKINYMPWFLLSLFCFQLKFACWLLLGPWILAQYWKWEYAWPSVSNGSSSSKFLVSIILQDKSNFACLGCRTQEITDEGQKKKKKTFQIPPSQRKGNYFLSAHRNKYSLYTLMVHPHFQLPQIVTAFSQWRDYIQTI